jgi:predicted metal-binding membrane protein
MPVFTGLLFLASTALTVASWHGMAAMGAMPMAGGWSLSMSWMRMPGESWVGVSATFVCMWAVMMVAMMLPSFLPMLLRYRAMTRFANPVERRVHTLTVAFGYFLVWTLAGALLFPLGVLVAALEMRSPALSRCMPMAAAATLIAAGLLQFTPWKRRALACCRRQAQPCCQAQAGELSAALRAGVKLGRDCCYCCLGLTAALLALGVMELWAMALVAAATTFERLAPPTLRAAQLVGALSVIGGLYLLGRGI